MKKDVFSSPFAYDIFQQKYAAFPGETWAQCCHRVVYSVAGPYLPEDVLLKLYHYMVARKWIPGGRYLFAAGKELHPISNCFAYESHDSREGWAKTLHDAAAILMMGGGFGNSYSKIREEGALISKTGSKASGPIPLMHMVNETARGIISGGDRRGACYAGLSARHPDIYKFLKIKDWSPELRKLKEQDPLFPLPMEYTNISVEYDPLELQTDDLALQAVFRENMSQACRTAEPGFKFKDEKGQVLTNACTEYLTDTSGDSCNLASLFISRITSREELRDIIHVIVPFLMCGRLYTDMPTEEIRHIGLKNNRIGLGFSGVADWLIQRQYPYLTVPELREWLDTYERESDKAADEWAERLNMNRPKGVRAIAPAGTIGILAETTTSIEPIYAKAYKRRYRKEGKWYHQYVIDGAVKRWEELGVDPKNIWDAGDLSFEDRVKFLADVQDYVDMGISITCNLPAWGEDGNKESEIDDKVKILMAYANRLRGFTVYPDGSRGLQPLTRCDLSLAIKKEGVSYEEREHSCIGGVCGV